MDISTENNACKNVMVNPLLKNKMEIQLDDRTIELSLVNMSKYFYKLYVLTPFKNEPVDKDIFSKSILKSKWSTYSSKLVLSETSIKVVNNFDHNHNITLVNSGDIQNFNHFGYDLTDKVLILPLFNVSYLNVKNYLKIYEGLYKLDDIYNIVVLNEMFSSNSKISYNSLIYMTDIIRNLEESNYWTRKYNCLLNISKNFLGRTFRLNDTHNIKNTNIEKVMKELCKNTDSIENNYLTMIFSSKNFVDASSAISKNGYKLYKIAKSCDMSNEDMTVLFSKLNEPQKFYMFSSLVISKKYCHLVINNYDVLKEMKNTINYFSDLYRYLFGYAWLRFYMEESIKKTWINKNDEFIFRINTASLLPVFPFTIDDPKSNPYIPLMVHDNIIQGYANFGGFMFFNSVDPDYQNQGITDLDGFKHRMNLFITGNSKHDIFNNLDWNKVGIGISGSIMAACLQKRHPLMNLFKGKNKYDNVSDFDLDYLRYFNEFYPEADVDVMIKSSSPYDFIKKSKSVYNQVVVNICGFNPANAEPRHVKMRTIRTVFLFINEKFVRENIVTDELNYEYIVTNLKEDKIIQQFKPYFDKKIKDFYDNLFEEYSKEEFGKIKLMHPELFEDNNTILQLHMSKYSKHKVEVRPPIELSEEDLDKILDDTIEEFSPEEDKCTQEQIYDELGINISFKVKISSNHIQRELELFSIFGEDFFALVSKFHMPCVRSFYDGEDVYLTPSCISAHMTYMNIDYKYFAGSKDPIEIILKYRMRGFGTFLNRKEIDTVINYIMRVPFWNNLYGINPENKDCIKTTLGWLGYKHKLFHPRLFNMDLFDHNIPYVNINDGYNNVEEIEPLTEKNVRQYMKNNFGVNQKNFNHIYDIKTISSNGDVEPVHKWVIDTIFNLDKNDYYRFLQETSEQTNVPNGIIDSNTNVPSGWSDVSSPSVPLNTNVPSGWSDVSSPSVPLNTNVPSGWSDVISPIAPLNTNVPIGWSDVSSPIAPLNTNVPNDWDTNNYLIGPINTISWDNNSSAIINSNINDEPTP